MQTAERKQVRYFRSVHYQLTDFSVSIYRFLYKRQNKIIAYTERLHDTSQFEADGRRADGLAWAAQQCGSLGPRI
jgi:hypothetical protein